MKKLNYEEIRTEWLKNSAAEAKLWLHHVDEKKGIILDLQQKKRVPLFEQAELLFHIFSYLNWLAHIDLRNAKHISEAKMVFWLQKTTSWPEEVAEAFWYCLRNPLMHTGRTFIFSDYDRKSTFRLKLFADLHPDLNFDPKSFQPQEYKPSEQEDGWIAVCDAEDERKLDVTFYFAGVNRKMEVALAEVINNIKVADNDSLASLAKVNHKLLAFRIVG